MTPDLSPLAETDVTEDVVRGLLVDQRPEWAALPLVFMAEGWDNVLFRLGDDLIVRVPRRQTAVALVRNEQRWLAELAPTLPLPVPAVVHGGEPTDDFPWPWSVVGHLPGSSVLDLAYDGARFDPPTAVASVPAARSLGTFVSALHRVAPPDAPFNPMRGIPLDGRTERLEDTLPTAAPLLGRRRVDAIRRAWADALRVSAWSGRPVWVHGDLHLGNVLADGTGITGVVDFGDLCAGDPAIDLLAAWMLFDADAREEFRRSSQVDDDTWARGRGWALAIGTVDVLGDPAFAAMGLRTLDAVLELS